jgi:hypothetical protein
VTVFLCTVHRSPIPSLHKPASHSDRSTIACPCGPPPPPHSIFAYLQISVTYTGFFLCYEKKNRFFPSWFFQFVVHVFDFLVVFPFSLFLSFSSTFLFLPLLSFSTFSFLLLLIFTLSFFFSSVHLFLFFLSNLHLSYFSLCPLPSFPLHTFTSFLFPFFLLTSSLTLFS